MSYVNPLHPSVKASQQSTFSALGGATAPFLSNKRRRVPQPLFTSSSKWAASLGRTNSNKPITFDLIGYQNQGIPMRELSARSSHALGAVMAGANDLIFVPMGIKRISFRICWPGYTHVDWTRSIEVATPTGPMTRAQLAATIAMNYARFIEKAQYERPSSSEWPFGPSGFRYESLVLVSLWNVYEDSWQADVAVDFP